MTITLTDIDLDLLMRQKQELIDLIWNDHDNILWGIVEMLDEVQDILDPP